jgi:hypothetical protein
MSDRSARASRERRGVQRARHDEASARARESLESSRARRDAAIERARERRDASIERSRRDREANAGPRASAAERARREREVSLLEMIDRLLAGGVVIHGDLTLAVADVDLLYVGLRAIIASVDTVERDLVGPLDRPRVNA